MPLNAQRLPYTDGYIKNFKRGVHKIWATHDKAPNDLPPFSLGIHSVPPNLLFTSPALLMQKQTHFKYEIIANNTFY